MRSNGSILLLARSVILTLVIAGGSLVGAIGVASAASSVPVPKGFRLMCLDHPSECRGGGAAQVHLSERIDALIHRVNASVNSTMVPVRNEVIDVWSVNATRGDCEEYVLAKRKALVRAGVPASSLRIVYALRNGGGHALLAVVTDRGTYILDNKTSAVKPITETGYRLVSMSGPNPMVWQRV